MWDHELQWIKAAKQRQNILLIHFEEIVKEPHKSIEGLQFLNITLNKSVNQIAKAISFDEMKNQVQC